MAQRAQTALMDFTASIMEDLDARFEALRGQVEVALAGVSAQREELASVIEKALAELCAGLVLHQQQELQRARQQLREEVRELTRAGAPRVNLAAWQEELRRQHERGPDNITPREQTSKPELESCPNALQPDPLLQQCGLRKECNIPMNDVGRADAELLSPIKASQEHHTSDCSNEGDVERLQACFDKIDDLENRLTENHRAQRCRIGSRTANGSCALPVMPRVSTAENCQSEASCKNALTSLVTSTKSELGSIRQELLQYHHEFEARLEQGLENLRGATRGCVAETQRLEEHVSNELKREHMDRCQHAEDLLKRVADTAACEAVRKLEPRLEAVRSTVEHLSRRVEERPFQDLS